MLHIRLQIALAERGKASLSRVQVCLQQAKLQFVLQARCFGMRRRVGQSADLTLAGATRATHSPRQMRLCRRVFLRMLQENLRNA